MSKTQKKNPNKKDLTFLGTFSKTHGVYGELIIDLAIDIEDIYGEFVFVEIDNYTVPLFIEKSEPKYTNKGDLIVKIKHLDDKQRAINFVSKKIFILKEKINTDNDFINFEDLIGFGVNDTNIGIIGNISEVLDIKNNPVLKVVFEDKDILLPVNALKINKIDYNLNCLDITTPNGLVDLYLNGK